MKGCLPANMPDSSSGKGNASLTEPGSTTKETVLAAQLAAAADLADIGIFHWDIPQAALILDDRAAELFGFGCAGSQPLAPLALRRFPIINRSRVLAEIRNALIRDGCAALSIMTDHPVSGPRELRISCRSLDTSDPRSGVAGAVTDYKLQNLQNDLMHVARLSAVGELGMALAHELNQPLGAIVNHLATADYLAGKAGPAPQARLLQAITDATEQAMRAGAILKRLRTFIEKGEADMRLEAVSTIVAEAVELLSSTIRERGIALKIENHAGNASVLADRVQIQQVLFNLLRNAIEALGAPGLEKLQLTLSTQIAASGNIEIVVKDTGRGVPADKARNLFQPFLSDKSDGMGVGLAISKRIVEAHGGQLTYERAEGGGAAFRLTLPAPSLEEIVDN